MKWKILLFFTVTHQPVTSTTLDHMNCTILNSSKSPNALSRSLSFKSHINYCLSTGSSAGKKKEERKIKRGLMDG
jgi:hypothetical protein